MCWRFEGPVLAQSQHGCSVANSIVETLARGQMVGAFFCSPLAIRSLCVISRKLSGPVDVTGSSLAGIPCHAILHWPRFLAAVRLLFLA